MTTRFMLVISNEHWTKPLLLRRIFGGVILPSYCGDCTCKMEYPAPETNIDIAPENQWLVQMIHLLLGQTANFQGLLLFVWGVLQCWVVVSNMFYFHPYLGKIPNLTSIFLKWVGKNHQLEWIWSLLKSFWKMITESFGSSWFGCFPWAGTASPTLVGGPAMDLAVRWILGQQVGGAPWKYCMGS